jgi:SAM-dependent methyltransferase
MTIYERLSAIYDSGWSNFSRQYNGIISDLLREKGIKRAQILDLACGTGVLAISLARKGHTVTGIDISPEMVRLAQSKSAGMSRVSFKVADMVDYRDDGEYDIVLCTFDSINYVLAVKDLRRMLGNIADALKPHGLFVFDSNTKWLYRHHHDTTQERELDGQPFIQECRYDAGRNRATTRFLFPDGTFEEHIQRPYGMKELEPLLNTAGLAVKDLFSWFDRRPYSSRTEKLFCVAQRR